MAGFTLPIALAGAALTVGGLCAWRHAPCCTSPCGGPAVEASAPDADWKLSAQVVEVRSASVFAGACHFNGELTTQGGEALLALDVASGSSGGVDLAGVSAVALVSSAENLKLDKPRRSIVYVSMGASAAQRERVVALLEERSHHGLGELVAIEEAPVSFVSTEAGFEVAVGDRIALTGAPLANRECCKMPNLVWYEPLVPLSQRLVGFTRSWSVVEPRLGLEFRRAEENSAFVGSLAFFEGACAAE